MSEVLSELDRAGDWLESWSNPIVDSLYARDKGLALQWLADARTALAGEAELSAGEKQTCALKLNYFEYQIHKALGSRDELGRAFGEALVALSAPVDSETAKVMQRILLCQLRSSGMRAGFRDFAPEEFRELFEGIPEDARTSELWHTVANWAFHRRDLETLEEAFGYFTVNADGWLSDYTWQHVNCMYQLVSGKATKKDVVEMIARITLTPQMDNFNKHLWPLVIELGLRDDETETLRQQMTERVTREGAFVPRKELRTKTTVREL